MKLYRGDIGNFNSFITDLKKAKREIYLVKHLLRKIKYKVYYKPYIEEKKRYADKDPIIEKIRKEKRITVISEKEDARYIIGNYRLIITMHTSSTLSWALMSNKPLIFINDMNAAPLSKNAYKLLEKSVFLYNLQDSDFYKK